MKQSEMGKKNCSSNTYMMGETLDQAAPIVMSILDQTVPMIVDCHLRRLQLL
jgi:hypothetical protein